ncbi:MAG TPA: hybrid sensor histidine kinase/response regulator [Isosphaeraceae bacterium]|jgi:signal transduction histidine kinase|nr:hybrid sensor histidine kinase/response regulator [Isosphaeraceae bacterium]
MATMLLIDDSEDIRALVRLLLTADGHEVIEAESGAQGLELAHRQRPDLILTDLAMPGLSGWDVIRELRSSAELAAIPAVALTAHAMKGDRERALAAGFHGFISKPIDDVTFAVRVRSFLCDRPPTAARPVEPPRVVTEEPEPAPARPDPSRRRVLVVDDNDGVLALTSQYLVEAGFEALAARDGPSAMAAVERDNPDLVVLDVILPGLDGYEVTARIKARPDAPFLPVVLVTAGVLDRERGLRAGADDFLGKPVDRVELQARVRSLLRLRDAVLEGRRQAEALRRLDQTKERFIATVAHDLRTPLNAMGLTITMLRMAPPEPAELDSSLQVLEQNVARMSDLLTGLLDYSQLVAGQQPLQVAPFDPRELLADVRDSLAATAAHRGLGLTSEAEEGLTARVVSDYSKCRQVVFNLASNALKFTERGGVRLVGRSAGPGAWAVAVIDTGVGIAADDLESIFEEFGQARVGRPRGAPGTGLGLSISRRLAERLGGGLSVSSVLDEGSTFTVTWPVQVHESAA